MARETKQCFGCKQQFRKEELVDHAGPNAKNFKSYCPACLKEKVARELFFDKVCIIFGIKAPGPRIWTERKRLIETYGYTDNIIIDCLDYIYNVEHKKKLTESLCLVGPSSVDKMMKYKKQQEYAAARIAQAIKTETKDHIVPIKENTTTYKSNWNPDDFLDD